MIPRQSTLLILPILALATLACAGTGSPGTPSIVSLEGTRVLVVPFNLGIRRPAELDHTTGTVAVQLVDVLEARGAQVASFSQAEAMPLWEEAFESASSENDFAGAAARFARLAAEDASFDWVLMPSLVLRGAEVRGHSAAWDGVRRDLPIEGIVSDPSFFIPGVRINGLAGQVSAASLHLLALRPDGSVAFENLAGLDVLQTARHTGGDAGQWQLEPRKEPLRDLEHVRHGVELAFERKLPKTASSWQP